MNDLAWADLLGALPPGTVYVDPTRGICLNASSVSAESPTLTELTQPGVIEFCFKLLDAASRAQKTKNNSLPAGSKLNAFSDPLWSIPNTGGLATARHTVVAQFTVSTAVATAPLT